MLYNFSLCSGKPISDRFLKLGLPDFFSAATYIRELAYQRNTHKNNAVVVLDEQGGTCSTKHALLKLLADENEQPAVKLMMGIYRMNAINTKPAKQVLEKYQLDYIPEAHNYLRVGNEIIDATKTGFSINHFMGDLLVEEEITPAQIGGEKVERHQAYLRQWLLVNGHIPYQLPQLWEIREECIVALSRP
jgi:hypothetical protein